MVLLVLAIMGIQASTMGSASAYNYYPADYYDQYGGVWQADECFSTCGYLYKPIWNNVSDQVDVAIMHSHASNQTAANDCGTWDYETRIQVYASWVSTTAYVVDYIGIYSPNLTWIQHINVWSTSFSLINYEDQYLPSGDWYMVPVNAYVTNSAQTHVEAVLDRAPGAEYCTNRYNVSFFLA